MTAEINNEKLIRLTAFVGRSFLELDKKIWHDLRDIFDSLKSIGFVYEDGSEGQIRPISEKIKELIMRHEVYIGVLTKRYPIWEPPSSWNKRWLNRLGSYEPQKWTTSEWVIEEVGFAIGKGLKVIILKEKDVHFPQSDLDGDTQWIQFDRENMSASQNEISEMILHSISQRVTSKEEPASVAATAPSSQEHVASLQEPSFSDQLKIIKEYVFSGKFSEADRIQNEIIGAETTIKERGSLDAFLLYFRARNNDNSALDRLKQRCVDDPSDFAAIVSLADVFTSFNNFNQATKHLFSHLSTIPDNQRSALVINLSDALCSDNKATEAIPLILECLQKETDESVHLSLYKEMVRVAEKASNPDLEIAFLEKVLKIVPTDNEARFQLAHVYSSNNLHRLAAYHYKLVVEHTDWPGASNNLGVAYDALGHKANRYKLYMSVAEQYPLSKANLAVLYASAGFLSEAEALANTALSTSNIDSDAKIAINRARYALEEITNLEKAENEAIGRIADDTKAEREFMCAYAEAYCMPSLGNAVEVYSTARGEVGIVREQDNLKGEGSFTRKAFSGLLAIASGNSEGSGVTTYFLSLSAQLHGQAGTFEIKISSNEQPLTLLGDSTRTIKGLLYFQDNGNVIQFLEYDENKRTVVQAQRKPR